jgi:hypothetical protein
MDEGKIIALGSPRGEIQSQTMGQSVIEIHCVQPLPDPVWNGVAKTLISPDRRFLSVYSQRPAPTLVDIVKWIDQQGIDLEDIHEHTRRAYCSSPGATPEIRWSPTDPQFIASCNFG